MEQLDSHWKDFHENWKLVIFRNSVEKIQVSLKSDKNNFTLTNIYIFIISRSIRVRMRNVWHKSCRGNQNTHFMFNIFFFENPAFYEIMWKIIVQPDRPQTTIWRMSIAFWIPTTTNTHSKYVTHCFSMTTMDAWTRLNVTFHVHFLPCLSNIPPIIITFCCTRRIENTQ
jgi:hypothetical protein